MCSTSSGCGPIPPRMPNTVWMNSGALHQPALQEMGEVVEVRSVVALELEARAAVAQGPQHELDVLEGVAEHQVARIFQRRRLPVMLEVLEPVQHGEQAEIHRAHVEGGDFRLEDLGRLDALLHRHIGRAAGGQIHHRVGRLLDARQEAARMLREFGRACRFRDRGHADGRSPRPLRRRRPRPRRFPPASPADGATWTGYEWRRSRRR